MLLSSLNQTSLIHPFLDKNDNETAASPDEELSSAAPVAEETNPLTDVKTEEIAEGQEQNDIEMTEEEVVEISRPRRENDFASFFLMWFLILALSFIIYRRLNKSYGIDLVQLADQYLTSLLP